MSDQSNDMAKLILEAKVRAGEMFRHFKGNFYLVRSLDVDADRNDTAFRVAYERAHVSEIDTAGMTESKRPFTDADVERPESWRRLCVSGQRFSRSLEGFVGDVTFPDDPGTVQRFEHVAQPKT